MESMELGRDWFVPTQLDRKAHSVNPDYFVVGTDGEPEYDPKITFTFRKSEWDVIHNCAGLGILYLEEHGWTADKRPDLAQEISIRKRLINWLQDHKF